MKDPRPIRRRMDAETFPETDRRRSARVLSALLAALALALGAGAWIVAPGYPAIAGVEGVLALVAAAGSVLEWRRARMAEAFALPASVLGFMAAPVLVAWSYWALGVVQGVLGLACALALARRFIVRDEARHRPKLKGKVA